MKESEIESNAEDYDQFLITRLGRHSADDHEYRQIKILGSISFTDLPNGRGSKIVTRTSVQISKSSDPIHFDEDARSPSAGFRNGKQSHNTWTLARRRDSRLRLRSSAYYDFVCYYYFAASSGCNDGFEWPPRSMNIL